jgi:hypothetical protein
VDFLKISLYQFKTEELRINLLDKYVEIEANNLSGNNNSRNHCEDSRRTSLNSLKENILGNTSFLMNRTLSKNEIKVERDEKRCEIQCELNSLGLCDFIIELFCKSDEFSGRLFRESVLLAIALLEGGNNQVQVL